MKKKAHQDNEPQEQQEPLLAAEEEAMAHEAEPASDTEPEDAAQRALDDLNDRYLRLIAEYDNYRRRTQREKDALYGDSIAAVTAEWLPVIDNLERAALAAEQCDDEASRSLLEGIEMVLRQSLDVLAKLGVEPIEAVGQPFDPELHEAVMHVEAEDTEPSTVIEEFQKGYRRGDRVIRHSMVKVAN